jgi:preprotein translocase subunit SecE
VSSDSGIGASAATFDDAPEPAPASSGKGAKKPPRGGRIRSIPRLYREVVAELRKVIWPTRRQLVGYSSVVLAFVTFMVLLVSGFDFVFTKAVLFVFG